MTQKYLEWMNDPDVTRYLEVRFAPPSSREELEGFAGRALASDDTLFLAIVRRDRSDHIGNIKLGPIEWPHRRGSIGIVIGERAAWGSGYATEAIGGIARYAFDELSLFKLTAGAYSTNVAALGAFQRVGFTVEARRERHYWDGDTFVDGMLLSRFRSSAGAVT